MQISKEIRLGGNVINVERAEPEAGLNESRTIAKGNGGRLLAPREFIKALKIPKFIEMACSRGYEAGEFWLEGNIRVGKNLLEVMIPNPSEVLYCRINYEHGSLCPVTEEVWERLGQKDKAVVSTEPSGGPNGRERYSVFAKLYNDDEELITKSGYRLEFTFSKWGNYTTNKIAYLGEGEIANTVKQAEHDVPSGITIRNV